MAPLATDSRELLLALEPEAGAAAEVRQALRVHGVPEDISHTVALLATELVSNAVRHAGLHSDQRIVLFARLDEDRAHVEVADPGPGFDPELVETDGYGLRLLDRLATSWGVDAEKGCRVWFEIDRSSGRFERG